MAGRFENKPVRIGCGALASSGLLGSINEFIMLGFGCSGFASLEGASNAFPNRPCGVAIVFGTMASEGKLNSVVFPFAVGV